MREDETRVTLEATEDDWTFSMAIIGSNSEKRAKKIREDLKAGRYTVRLFKKTEQEIEL